MYHEQISQVGKALGSKNMGRGCRGEVWGTVNRVSTAGTQGSWEGEV